MSREGDDETGRIYEDEGLGNTYRTVEGYIRGRSSSGGRTQESYLADKEELNKKMKFKTP
jgi:hypothetical protein